MDLTSRTSERKWVRTVLGFALIALVATACGGSSSSDATSSAPGTAAGSASEVGRNLVDSGDPVDGGSLVAAVTAETDGWNPHRNQWATWSAFVGSSFLEPLAKLNEDGTAGPWLADSFTPNATFDEWTLALRQDVTFQNGEPFNAQAVKANIDDALSAPLSGIALKGLITSTTVVDAYTVKVNLDRPWASFPTSFLTSQVAFMMAPAMLAQPDGGQTHPIGTGPFTFDDWTVGTKVKTSRNDNYWRPGEPHLNELDFLVIGDSVSQIDALRSGDVDMITTQDPEAPNKLGDSYQMVKNWTTEPSMVVTNTLPEVNGAPNPLANQHARLALAYATDRASLAAQFGAGVVSPTSPFSPGSVWGQPTDQNGYVDFDLEKAKNEVELYKQDTGGKDLSLTLTGEAATTGQLVQVLQQQWQNAGIHTTLETLESAAFISQVVVGKFQLAVFPIYTAPDPDQNYFIWTSTNVHPEGELSINFAHLKSDVIDKDLEIGHANPDHDARKAAYADLVKELNRNAVNIWLYWATHTLAASPRVGGLQAVTKVPWANHDPKLWWGQIWIAPK